VVVSTAAAWLFGFPDLLSDLWMILSSSRPELDAFATRHPSCSSHWTTENYATVQERSDYVHHADQFHRHRGSLTLIAMLIR